MIKFLLKVFVKDYNNVNDIQVRTAYGYLASIAGIILNVCLFVVKLIIGLLIKSISIMADGFNNLSDAGSSIVGFIGVKLAKKPADKEHPFGHGRLEYVAALIVAFIILIVGINVSKEAFIRILNPRAIQFNWIMIIILSLSIFVKVWLALFNKYLGKKINSALLKAIAVDARNDVIITSATIVSLIIEHFTTYLIDGWVGLCVALFVVYSGVKIAKDTIKPLIGTAIDKQTFQNITQKVGSYPGIIGTHDFVAHNYGPTNIMATIHVEISKDSNIEDVHLLIDKIESDIQKETGISLLIHVDPVAINNQKMIQSKNKLLSIILELEALATIHDYHVHIVNDKIQLWFDLVVPYSYDEDGKTSLVNNIKKKMKQVNPKYVCYINVENSFIEE